MSVSGSSGMGWSSDSGFVFGNSSAIQGLNRVIEEIARTDIPVLLMGESGTGKEVYTRLIHRLSRHSHRPLIKLSCRALEPAEFLAQLRICLGTEAEDAPDSLRTLFLDGIDELDMACQKALLSMLPDGEHEKNGNGLVRLITSASWNLEKEVDGGRFRKELFFRINGVSLRLPPLRERKEDIQALLEYFLEKHAAEIHREVPTLSKEESESLTTYNWPGNIRELENFARKISMFGHTREAMEELRSMPKIASMLPGESQTTSLKVVARAASRQAERELIREALERTHWNRKRAAQQLNISYKSLLYKIKQTGLEG
jgi:two-component system response regulator AtoC